MQNHVLILDDEADVRAAIRLQLKGTHFEILEADSFERAQELLRDNAITVDVIICDVRMPGVDEKMPPSLAVSNATIWW